MSYRRGFPAYWSVAQQKQDAARQLAWLREENPDISPVVISGKTIATTWWGKAWCENLKRYADFHNRIGRGSSYVRHGFVYDLQIEEGAVSALVGGSYVYRIDIEIDVLSQKKWNSIVKACARRIESVSALAEGEFPEELSHMLARKGEGLFPSSQEIHMRCSCPDRAYLCKHIAATLYGVGAKLDHDPLLFFKLRGIDPTELIKKSIEDKMKTMLANSHLISSRAIDEENTERIFGISHQSV
jgi:uncharacterized Zn finger protein